MSWEGSTDQDSVARTIDIGVWYVTLHYTVMHFILVLAVMLDTIIHSIFRSLLFLLSKDRAVNIKMSSNVDNSSNVIPIFIAIFRYLVLSRMNE